MNEKTTEKTTAKVADKISIYEKLAVMRVQLLDTDIKKSGYNDFKKYHYTELSDFLPEVNRIAAENKALFLYAPGSDVATLTLINLENTEEKIEFSMQVGQIEIQGANAMQNIGGVATYTRRYLYMMALEISEHDSFEDAKEPTQKEIDKEAEKRAKEEEKKIASQVISEVKIKVLYDKMESIGVNPSAICTRYKIAKIEDTTEELFVKIISALNATEEAKKKAAKE